MPAERRAAQLGEEFHASYPDTLPGRLEWLANHLDIDRPRFLRLMGLTPDEVEANLQTPWKVIFAQWKDEARWIEELLCQLIAFFGYDWKALANRLHQPTVESARPELEGVSRLSGHFTKLRTVPSCNREEMLLALIHQGGQDVLGWLLEYLTLSLRDGAKPKLD
ncbi:MAG: hypothetical protein JO112_10960 [Planctomycetes bacterium]|nr:hypothetical protein [Planctomycetota bacterium]